MSCKFCEGKCIPPDGFGTAGIHTMSQNLAYLFGQKIDAKPNDYIQLTWDGSIIRRSYDSYTNKKENENMNTSNFNNYSVCAWSREKTQEEIELDEKINKIRAEADKKIAKLKADFKEQTEKKNRDAKSKEIHDKYQSLIDAGFDADQAYDILKTKLGEFDL